jgi:hypothetical protein
MFWCRDNIENYLTANFCEGVTGFYNSQREVFAGKVH